MCLFHNDDVTLTISQSQYIVSGHEYPFCIVWAIDVSLKSMVQLKYGKFLHTPNNSFVSVRYNKSIPMPWIHHGILRVYWLQCYINAEWRHTSQILPLFGSMNEAPSGRDDWPIEPVSSFLSWCTLHHRLVKWFPF